MKKLSLFLLMMTFGIAVLFSCGSKDDAPEGLQTADKNENGGYIFYAPEHWAVINSESVSAAKVSQINNTSVTFTEAQVPKATIPEYFDESMATMPESIKETMKILERDKSCAFGNADGECFKYIFTYKYQEFDFETNAYKYFDFACMQILVSHGGRFFIFTYNSYGDVNDEGSEYRKYLDEVQLCIDSFMFTEQKVQNDTVSYPKDSDGYNMVSDPKISGFELYLPDDYEVLYSDAYVKAKITDGANVSLSKATQTGIDIIDYLELRKQDMQIFATDFTDVKISFTKDIPADSTIMTDWSFDTAPTKDSALVFGDLDKSGLAAYEYTYVFNGNTYHVYQVMGVGSFSGYVFTYTALEAEYAEHIDEIKTILGKVKF